MSSVKGLGGGPGSSISGAAAGENAVGTVLFPFVGDSVGGSHVSALTLIDALPALGVQPVVGLHRTDGPLAEYLQHRGTPFEELPSNTVVSGGSLPRELAAMVRSAQRLAPLLRHRSWRLVHSNDARMHLTWTLAARLARGAHVWHQRTVNPSRRLAYYSRLPARVITISEYCRSGLPAAMAARAQIIDEPFHLPEVSSESKADYRRALRAEFAIPPEAPIVGFVGNMESQKRPEVFLEAAARQAQKTGDTCHFVMVGDARDFLTAGRRAELQRGALQERLHFAGARFPILPYMAGFDVLLAPGVHEGLGRTVIEAMLLSTAVIAADDGGHRDIVSHCRTGLLARPDDATDFAAKLGSLIDDAERRTTLAMAGNTEMRQRYSVDRHANTLAMIYAQLASNFCH